MHDFSPFTSFTPGLALSFLPLVIVVVLWTIFIKGFALWHAARSTQKWWFIAILVLNTVGILEVIYLIWFRPTSSHPTTPAVSSSQE